MHCLLEFNKGVLDWNKFPDQGLDFGLECQELKKRINNMVNI